MLPFAMQVTWRDERKLGGGQQLAVRQVAGIIVCPNADVVERRPVGFGAQAVQPLPDAAAVVGQPAGGTNASLRWMAALRVSVVLNEGLTARLSSRCQMPRLQLHFPQPACRNITCMQWTAHKMLQVNCACLWARRRPFAGHTRRPRAITRH